ETTGSEHAIAKTTSSNGNYSGFMTKPQQIMDIPFPCSRKGWRESVKSRHIFPCALLWQECV
ncbi:hypothetical protein, partial [Paenibacillus thermotolerans]|uniref:hypothetical protein n=1 Tax=Paenibacillus thermotolerans TaxID=3027807 RepID=UPI0023674388